ncbi:MAG: protein phosphatase 2C domain-containing protein [Bryobacteraceae bacterium]
MLEIEFAQASDCGRVRDHNEDYLGCFAPEAEAEARTLGFLFALADGVGGGDDGEVASKLAIETLLQDFRRSAAGVPHSSLLPRLVQQANTRVFETGLSHGPGGSNMATTLVACALRYDRVVVSHVGDSRCYRIRHGHAEALTRDHTVAGEHMRLGLITAGEASSAETRHVLSRSLGPAMIVAVETRDYQLIPGDVLLLCSDGLHGPVAADAIAQLVSRRAALPDAAKELIDLANELDGGDNVSVQLIRVRQVERIGMYRGRPYKLA